MKVRTLCCIFTKLKKTHSPWARQHIWITWIGDISGAAPSDKTLVRLNLEHCVHFCSPHYRKDMVVMERVRRRFTRRFGGLEDFSYMDIG